MSRPLAAAGLSFMFGCVMFAVLGAAASVWTVFALLAVCVLLFLLRLLSGKNISLILTASGFSALALLYCISGFYLRVKPLEKYTDGVYTVTGTVTDEEHYSSGTRYTVNCSSLSDESGEACDTGFSFSTFLYADCETGDEISGEFTFSPADSGMFESSWGDDIYLEGTISGSGSLTVTDSAASESTLTQLRKNFESRLFCCLDTVSAKLCDAMLLGNREYIKDSTLSDFRLSGVSHLLVVSGLHLSLCAALAAALLELLGISFRLKELLSMLFVLAFMLVSGMSSSVVRAGVMFITCSLARLAGREYDSLTSLSFAAFILLLRNPYAAASAGFLYTFSATLGIELFSGSLSDFFMRPFADHDGGRAFSLFRRLWKYLTSVFSVSLAASLLTMPVSMLMGSSGGLLSAVSGTVMSLPAAAVIGLGMVFALLPHSLHFLAEPLKIIISLCVRFILRFVKLFSAAAGFSPGILAPLAAMAMLAVIILSAFILRKSRFIAVFVCFAIVGASLAAEYIYFTDENSAFLVVCSSSGGYSAAVVSAAEAELYVTDASSLCDMKEALSLVHCSAVSNIHYKSSISPSRLSAIDAAGVTECSEKYLRASVSGCDILFEMNTRQWDHESCDVFVSASLLSDVSSAFTIIADSDIIDTSMLPSGPCVLGSDEETVIIELSGDTGSFRFLNSSFF